jgi:Uma2 family endonuclease
MQITDKTYFYTPEQFHLVREFAGNFFEQVEGQIVWRQTGQAVEEEILEAILNEQDVIIEYMTTKEHALIISNINQELHTIDKSLFRLFIQDPCICVMIDGVRLRARIPDATVTPKKINYNEFGEALNPLVVFEIISPSSVKTDYIEKLREYKYVDSLQDYLIVEQKTIQITHYQKINEKEWVVRSYDKAEEILHIHTIGIAIMVGDVYVGLW